MLSDVTVRSNRPIARGGTDVKTYTAQKKKKKKKKKIEKHETVTNSSVFNQQIQLRQVIRIKPVTHLAILYADRGDRRKSPGVPGAAMAIFADRRDRRKSPISGMSDIGD